MMHGSASFVNRHEPSPAGALALAVESAMDAGRSGGWNKGASLLWGRLRQLERRGVIPSARESADAILANLAVHSFLRQSLARAVALVDRERGGLSHE